MQITKFKANEHYEQLCGLWESYKWIPCPLSAIPRKSYVATKAGVVIAFMGMYLDDGKAGFIEWAVGNKKASADERDRALRLIFAKLVYVAKLHGCFFVYSVTGNMKWAEKLESFGMVRAEQNVSSYVKLLGQSEDIGFISD